MTKRKFYKTVVQVTVLSEGPLENCGLEEIDYAITNGDCSGHVEEVSSTELNGKQAADALAQQASDPGFFNLTEKGEDSDE